MLRRLSQRGRVRRLLLSAMIAITAAAPGLYLPSATAASTGDWPMSGRDLQNSRTAAAADTRISTANAKNLAVKWTYTTHGDVSATPAVVGNAVYFPDWGGYLHKINAATGAPIWQRKISEYTGIPGSVSRSSPAIVGSKMYIGDWSSSTLIAVDINTGNKLWTSTLDDHYKAVLTMPPVVYNGIVYQGVSSRESESGLDPNFPCCTFRGSATATDANTGRLIWKKYTTPENGGKAGGYSGVAVWGVPAIDTTTNTIYFSTGNNYTVPKSVTDCQNAGHKPYECFDPNNHVDSVLALDTRTGALKWASGARRFDAWNTGCIPGFPPNNCPENHGDDWDFGDGTHLFTIKDPATGRSRKVIGAGQKSGEYWLMDAATGAVVWSAAPGPGGHVGGIEWGTAYDGKRIYLAEANFTKAPYTLPDGTTTTRSSFAALCPDTGQILWQVADKTEGFAWAALTVTNGVLFASSTSGHMYAINAATGATLWDFKGPYSSNAGPAVVNGTVYWGNGYIRFADGAGTTGSYTTGTFYAFTVDGK